MIFLLGNICYNTIFIYIDIMEELKKNNGYVFKMDSHGLGYYLDK
jgi:hypothetical protein